MNPLGWEDVLQRLDHNDSGVNNMGKALRTSQDYLSYTVSAPHSSMALDMEMEELSPCMNNFDGEESGVENPDGKPLQVEEDLFDLGLARKQRELREIEQQIMFKKASIALKTVTPGFSCNGQLATCNGETLRDRVTLILQERNSHRKLPKLCSPKSGTNSFLLEDHPLKLRVKALMKQRSCGPRELPVSDIPPSPPSPPPRQNLISPAKEGSSDNIGFQRFLSVLNKGVDIDFLSRIVNDDCEELAISEDLPMVHPPAVENKSKLAESRLSRSTASPPDCSLISSQEKPYNNIAFLSGDEVKKKNDSGDGSLGCRRRESKSPPAVKKKKTEEEMPKVAVQQEQLQNILKTLGLTLEVEELSKLSDRTQERLYGKKNEDGEFSDVRQERQSRQKGSNTLHKSSSSSSSSGSTSPSRSPSPSRCQSSQSRDTKQRRVSEYGSSGEGSHNSVAAQTHERRDHKEILTYQYSQTQSHSHPPAFHGFTDYSLPQYSEYSANNSDASGSYSAYTQAAVPPAPAPRKYPYPPITEHHFPRRSLFEDINLLVNPDLSTSEGQSGSSQRCLRVIKPNEAARQPCLKELTKGQKRKRKYIKMGKWYQRLSRRRKRGTGTCFNPPPPPYNTFAQTLQAPQGATQGASRGASQGASQGASRGASQGATQGASRGASQGATRGASQRAPQGALRGATRGASQGASQGERCDLETQPKEEKRPQTEEEIKMNLRRKLEAFNQRVKQQVPQPPRSLTSHTESVDNLLESQP